MDIAYQTLKRRSNIDLDRPGKSPYEAAFSDIVLRRCRMIDRRRVFAMLSALCLISGVMIAQEAPPAAPPVRPPVAKLLKPVAVDEPKLIDVPGDPQPVATPSNPPDNDIVDPAETDDAKTGQTDEDAASSIFSRPIQFDRSSLSFVFGSGPGRFNMIDWESRPNADRFWWLGRWPEKTDAQLYLGVGFNIHWWAGPVGEATGPPPPNRPPQVFDLYLDANWSQRWCECLTSQVRFRPGLYTDFRVTPPDAFRFPGEAVLAYQVQPNFFLVGGVQYLQRLDVQVLPVGGVLWQPTTRWEMTLVFPEPKIAYQLSTKHHIWGYVAGEYGGGRWAFKNELGHDEEVEYSDLRVTAGLEWREGPLGFTPLAQLKTRTFIEAGYIFDRHLRFNGPNPAFEPSSTWMLRFGTVW
jgi:hypothetical protein